MSAASSRRLEVAPERLDDWVRGFAERHGEPEREVEQERVWLRAADGALAVLEVPFPPLPEGTGLAEHALRPRRVGLVLVRRGGFAAGVAEAGRLVSGRAGTRHVQGRTAAGGSSQQRFARRREGQAAALLDAAARLVAEEVGKAAGGLDAVLLGGDRLLLGRLREDPRLAPLRPLVLRRVLDVPDPRRRVLEDAARRSRAVSVRLSEPG